MRYYPLLLDLHGKHCLIVGLGKVGQRKLATLLKAQPEKVTVLDTFAPSEITDAEITTLLNSPTVDYVQRNFTEDDLCMVTLVFAATGNRAINEQIAKKKIATKTGFHKK